MPSVLIADDSSSLRRLIGITLRSQGWTVYEASTPPETIAAAQRSRPDAVLLDVVFEGEVDDGYTVCRKLTERGSVTAHIPVVMLTARSGEPERKLAEEVGAAAYLTKPFGPIELLSTLRTVMRLPTAEPAIGLFLLAAGRVRADQLSDALTQQQALAARGEHQRLGEVLVRDGIVREVDVERALAEQRRVAEASPDRPGRPIRIVIADDHEAIREGLRTLFTTSEGFELVGVAEDGAEAVRMIAATHPDVAIVDNAMPSLTGVDVVREVTTKRLPTATVLFSMDATIRDVALGAGAAAFLTKDAEPRMLVSEVRRAAHRAVPEVADGTRLISFTNASKTAWSTIARQRRAAAIIGVITVAYCGAFLVAEPELGASAGVLAIAAVALTGALLGPEAGVIGTLIFSVANLVLWNATGHVVGEPVVTIGGNAAGIATMLMVGAGFGAMRVVQGRFDAHGRRVDAIGTAAAALAAPDGEGLRAAVEAGRASVPADALLLFAPVGGAAALEVVAVSGAPRDLIGLRQATATGPIGRVFVEGAPRVANDLSAGVALALVPKMRSALFVPVTVIDASPAGVLVALSSQPQAFDDAHAAALARCSPLVWLALRSARPMPATVGLPSVARDR